MLSLHFNKQDLMTALKTNSQLLTFISTTVALMLTLTLQGLIQGNLKAEYFAYALIVSLAFYVWSVIDQKYR